MSKTKQNNEVQNEEMENVQETALVSQDNEGGLFKQSKARVFCSVNAETEEEKKKLFNTLEQCDALLNDCVGTEIEIKDVYCEEREVVDEDTGEVKTKFRTILFATNGQTYATGSYGIFNVIKKIIQIYGFPTWENGIKVKVAKRPIKDGKQTLTLNLL